MSKMIQVRSVPDRLHRELVRRAKARKLTLTDYIQEILEREVARPPAEEVFERIARRPPVRLGSAGGGPDPGASAAGGRLSGLVADASALLEYLLRTEVARPVETVLRAEAEIHVPSLCDVEVATAAAAGPRAPRQLLRARRDVRRPRGRPRRGARDGR